MLKNDKVNKQQEQDTPQEQMKLDDARRVKVLSPGMLVFKRFIRNKLAVTGIIILIIMFTFAFLGPVFSPYKIAQLFTKQIIEPGEYASAKINRDSRIYDPNGVDQNLSLKSAYLKQLGSMKGNGGYVLTAGQEIEFVSTDKKTQYVMKVINPDPVTPSAAIYPGAILVATATKGNDDTYKVKFENGVAIDDEAKNLITENAAQENKGQEIPYKDSSIKVVPQGKISIEYYMLPQESDPIAVSSFNIFTAMRGRIAELQSDAIFLNLVNIAIQSREEEVQHEDGTVYKILIGENNTFQLADSEGTPLFEVTRLFHANTVSVEGEDDPVEFDKTIPNPNEFRQKVKEVIDETEKKINVLVNEGKAEGKTQEEIFKSISDADLTAVTFLYPVYEDEAKEIEAIAADEKNTPKEYILIPSLNEEETYFNGEYVVLSPDGQPGLEVYNSYDPVESKYDLLSEDYMFIAKVEEAITANSTSFTYGGEAYKLEKDAKNNFYIVYNAAGAKSVLVSEIAYGAVQNGTELTVDFVLKVQDAIWNKLDGFTFTNERGEETKAYLHISNENSYVRTDQRKTLLDDRAPLSEKHILGTDVHGMDVMTRLMYGGRVSLLVGFVVVFFEIVIGVLVGGISGYFGGIVDTFLMRFVELFNAIPFYPMVIILGSVMDAQRVDPYTRLMLLMVVLGILGWTGIARIVRGQILSLREQDFMIATEATGIRTSRRIFRHLIPNVMPLLIVYATAGLGSVILTEATLGFLGLGVKYPMASWGSIINQSTDMQVMTTAWWIWIPSGLLILLTVLGFNFVGDGLRDAFDPKMKR